MQYSESDRLLLQNLVETWKRLACLKPSSSNLQSSRADLALKFLMWCLSMQVWFLFKKILLCINPVKFVHKYNPFQGKHFSAGSYVHAYFAPCLLSQFSGRKYCLAKVLTYFLSWVILQKGEMNTACIKSFCSSCMIFGLKVKRFLKLCRCCAGWIWRCQPTYSVPFLLLD